MRLNEEQKKMVEDNHNLIYDYIKKHHLKLDDYYDILAIVLCECAITYDTAKGAFSTYVYQAMHQAVLNNIVHDNIRKKHIVLQDDAEVRKTNLT